MLCGDQLFGGKVGECGGNCVGTTGATMASLRKAPIVARFYVVVPAHGEEGFHGVTFRRSGRAVSTSKRFDQY